MVKLDKLGRALPLAEQVDALLPQARRRRALVLAGIITLTFLLYLPTLNDGFQTDDFLLLRGAHDLPFLTYIREAFDFRDVRPLQLLTYRPLQFVGMDVMHMAFGLNALPYHAVSVCLHVVNVILVWRIVHHLSKSEVAAYIAALIFGLHPAYAEAVGWVAANNSLAATTGALTSFLLFIEFAQHGSLGWLSASLAAYAGAILFHQEVFLLPVVLAAYMLLIRFSNLRAALRPTLVALLPYGLVLGIFVGIQRWNAQEGVINDHFVLDIDTLKNHVGMVAMSVFPSHLSSLQNVHILAAALFVAFVTVGLLLRPARWRIIVLGVVWYHASLVLSELFFTGLPAVPYLARKLYPAAPALALIIAVTLESYWQVLKPRAAVARPIALALGGIALVLALMRAGELRDQLEPQAELSGAFVHDMRASVPTLHEGATLYIADAPFYCDVITCYTRDIVALYYDDITVRLIGPALAGDPTFLATLRPDDRVFCFRCLSP